MDKLAEQLAKFKKLDIWKIVKKVLNDNSAFIEDLVIEQQRSGQMKTGDMPNYMSESYEDYKRSIGKLAPNEKVNLWDDGDFQKKLTAEIRSQVVEIFSTDSKASELENIYSKEIYELNEDGMIELKNEILPFVLEEIRKQLDY